MQVWENKIMSLTVYLALVFSIVLAGLLGSRLVALLRKRRAEKLYTTPLLPAWIDILRRRVAIYSVLPDELRQVLHGHISFFLHDKKFVGRNGLAIDDDIRLTIAGNACLLALGHNRQPFSHFKTILVYPDTYVARQVSHEGGVQTHSNSSRHGESWHRGPIVLSWADVLRGSIDGSDGHNVVLHEFAHKLDEENVGTNGTPVLRDSADYAEWVKVLNREYSDFLTRVAKRNNKIIDAYGAVSPPEFFAVATESFFEKARAMAEQLPDLYQQLAHYYGVDPASWD